MFNMAMTMLDVFAQQTSIVTMAMVDTDAVLWSPLRRLILKLFYGQHSDADAFLFRPTNEYGHHGEGGY